MVTSLVQFLALVSLGLIAGATFYSSLVEIPVRQKTKPGDQVHNWHLVFPAASGLLKTFGILTLPLVVAAGYSSGNWLWYVSAVLMFALIPFTAVLIAATNDKLLAITVDKADDTSASLVRTWDKLHHVRTVLAGSAFVVAAYAATS